MGGADQFILFVRLRNAIIHFAVPNEDLSRQTFRFLFEVVEPLTQEFWGESIMDYASEWDEVTVSEGYLEEQLDRCQIGITPPIRAVLDRIYGEQADKQN